MHYNRSGINVILEGIIMPKNGIEYALLALDVELERLWETANQLWEIYVEEFYFEYSGDIPFDLQQRFVLQVKKRDNCVQIHWKRKEFGKKRGQTVRMDKHLPLKGKDHYPAKTFKKARGPELSAIHRLEEEFTVIRKMSNKILNMKKSLQQYQHHHMNNGPLAFDQDLDDLYAAVKNDLQGIEDSAKDKYHLNNPF